MVQVFVINPDTNAPVTIKDWRKDENPTRAQLLVIKTDDGHMLCMSKSYLPGEYTFEDAQKACAAFSPMSGVTFRSPSRKECIDIYDARFLGLDEAIELTGGDYAKSTRQHWTGERDTDPKYASYAWCSYGCYGFLGDDYVCISCLALPVAVVNL